MTKPTGRPRGRPRRGGEKPRENDDIRAAWNKPGFIEICKKRYDAASRSVAKQAARRGGRSFSASRGGLISEAARATYDPLFSDRPIEALKAYGLLLAKRPSRLIGALSGKVWGSEAEALASYARLLERNIGISRRRAIADAVAICAERGTYILSNGRPVSFERAIRAVYEAMRAPLSRDSIGFTGHSLHVKPAVDGALVRQPHREYTPLPPEGAFVPDDLYWRRRIMHGDVVEVP
jgi:hypothetical protein